MLEQVAFKMRNKTMAEKLGVGSSFPSLQLQIVGGQQISLPQDIGTDFAVVLFYRGHW